MSSGNSSSRRHRGPKQSRCYRAPTPASYTSTSASSTASSTAPVSPMVSERDSVRSTRSIGSCVSIVKSALCSVVAPDLEIKHGDVKNVYQLKDKGRLVVINRTNGEIVYMLRCVDGRRVFIEKGAEGASLIITNPKGKVIKSIAAQYPA
ncbi:hypothetical protein GCK72_001932 [Caenorhabditis remanei]|nr:hypothetical protein GCK72_001932 [Caenorhabditis remanei]KAF1770114.1 hypothetical protein GCK72_001932 [Caenorhabditis remanei]